MSLLFHRSASTGGSWFLSLFEMPFAAHSLVIGQPASLGLEIYGTEVYTKVREDLIQTHSTTVAVLCKPNTESNKGKGREKKRISPEGGDFHPRRARPESRRRPYDRWFHLICR